MAIFGKALGNGYAITAVIGKREVMECVQNTFISSTFWTERIGSVAGLETLKIMKDLKSWNKIDKIGKKIKKMWKEISKITDVPIEISGLNSLAQFKIASKYSNIFKTFITQEMLKKGILASDAIYVSIKHNDKILQNYYENLEKIFKIISEYQDGRDIKGLLEGSESLMGLPRLN
jgi:glutamate-1-semialdehyde 2,1-aminomutase